LRFIFRRGRNRNDNAAQSGPAAKRAEDLVGKESAGSADVAEKENARGNAAQSAAENAPETSAESTVGSAATNTDDVTKSSLAQEKALQANDNAESDEAETDRTADASNNAEHTSDDDEEAVGATDSDGLRAARARLSLDDAAVRSVPKDTGDESEPKSKESTEVSEEEVASTEGRVEVRADVKLPYIAGACGKAGWEPLRGVNRRRTVEVRKENQDAYLALFPFDADGKQVVAGVFDGHGAEGRLVSHYVRDSVVEHLRKLHGRPGKVQLCIGDDEPEGNRLEIHRIRADYLRKAFESAEAELLMPAQGIEHKFSGTTAAVAWLFETDIYCAWVGDSRCVLGRLALSVGSEGKIKAVELTYDQKPVRGDEKRRVKAAGGRIARWRKDVGPLRVWVPTDWLPGLAMTRSIGDTVLSAYGVCPTPEVSYTKISANDSFLVIASDGVWEFMTSQEVVEFVAERRREGESANAAADALVREAVRRWRRFEAVVDDTTAVVVYFDFSTDANFGEAVRPRFPFGKAASGPRPMLVNRDGKLSNFAPKNEEYNRGG